MKFINVHPKREKYDFLLPDLMVEFAMKNNQKVRGHTLVWYAHHPDWINNNYFSKEELKAILKNIYKQWLSVTKEEYTLGML